MSVGFRWRCILQYCWYEFSSSLFDIYVSSSSEFIWRIALNCIASFRFPRSTEWPKVCKKWRKSLCEFGPIITVAMLDDYGMSFRINMSMTGWYVLCIDCVNAVLMIKLVTKVWQRTSKVCRNISKYTVRGRNDCAARTTCRIVKKTH